jgi:hypothetical protein
MEREGLMINGIWNNAERNEEKKTNQWSGEVLEKVVSDGNHREMKKWSSLSDWKMSNRVL